MRNFKFFLLACLMLTGCTAKEILVSTPVDMDVTVDRVGRTKLVFSIKVSNQDAHYCYSLFPAENTQEYFTGTDQEIAEKYLNLDRESYATLNNNLPQECSFTEYACYRGNRTLKMVNLKPNYKYKLLVFQVDPVQQIVIGNVISKVITTKALDENNLFFTFDFSDQGVTITPSDSEATYYWDFERSDRIYDSYLSPYLYFYSLLDMYEDYGFINNILYKGVTRYDFGRDGIKEGVNYVLIAAACSNGEIASGVTEAEFSRKGESLYVIYQKNPDQGR